MDVTLEEGASAHFIAHCLFPDATQVRHLMDAKVEIGAEAELRYHETHYHGPHGGVKVVPKAQVTIGRYGRYSADFTLTIGRVGTLAAEQQSMQVPVVRDDLSPPRRTRMAPLPGQSGSR